VTDDYSTSSGNVSDSEVEEVMEGRWTTTGKEQAGFPFISNSGVQVPVNYGQSVMHYCLVFSIYRGAKTNEDRVEIKVWFSTHSSDEIVENVKLPLKRLPHFLDNFFFYYLFIYLLQLYLCPQPCTNWVHLLQEPFVEIENIHHRHSEQISNWRKEIFQERSSTCLSHAGKEISTWSSFVPVYIQQSRRLNKLVSNMVSKKNYYKAFHNSGI
jgi:hypothetical protein